MIIYQEPMGRFSQQPFDPFFNDDIFFQPPAHPFFSPFNSFLNLNSFPSPFQDPFGLSNSQSILMSKMLNSLPSFYNFAETNKFEEPNKINKVEKVNDLNNVESCNSVSTEARNVDDNFKNNFGFMYHFESSTCHCNKTDHCKFSFTKPDLDFCHLKEIESEDGSLLNNCELIETCFNDVKNCDGIYVDHRSMKFFKVYCNGDKAVQNVAAKSAKQYIIQLKSCF
jgi:hypothetical protein